VTGGAGFIGRYCVRSFLEKNYEVTIFDNFSNSSEDMVSDLLDDGAKFVEGDITIQDQVSNAISGHDVVIHLAAKNSVEDSIKFPEKTFATNIDGTKNILDSCIKHNIKNLIATSSAAVYGETQNLPISENHKTSPSSPYGESKLKMEQLIQSFLKKHNLNSIILRIFNVYGLGQTPEYAGVITKFLERISKNEPLEIFGNGQQTRDFVYIEDVVSALEKSIEKVEENHASIINIGSGKSTTIKNIAEQLIKLSRRKIEIKYSKQRKGDIRNSCANISLAKKYLHYNPKIEFNEGFKNLLNGQRLV